jgi:glycerophosphoryl diester phosphodiesterase
MNIAHLRHPLVCFSIALLMTSTHAFDLQGHRGARGLLPENTIAAFERALQIGVTTLELDVGITKDGVVVISHDRALNPEITRDASGTYLTAPVLVNRLTLAEIKTYDVGRINPTSPYAQRFPDQQPLDGARMPALSTLFKRVQALNAKHVQFNIETKISPANSHETPSPTVFARKLMDVIRQHNMTSRTTVQSFDWRTLQLIAEMQKAQTKQVKLSCLSAQQPTMNTITPPSDKGPFWTGSVRAIDHADVPSMVKAAGCHIWSPHFADINKALVDKAHDLNLKVIPWTTNSEAEMNAALEAGVDGLITDYPDRARAFLLQRSIKLPDPVTFP